MVINNAALRITIVLSLTQIIFDNEKNRITHNSVGPISKSNIRSKTQTESW